MDKETPSEKDDPATAERFYTLVGVICNFTLPTGGFPNNLIIEV